MTARDDRPGLAARGRELVRWHARRVTAPARVLPDFLIIGAQRAGSTSLFDQLCRHPALATPTHKELHYFDNNHWRGLGWYRARFPTALECALAARRARAPARTGEASPYYLFHPLVPARVRRVVPAVRLIALLRDPVERAYGHYQLARRLGHETLSFEQAIAVEPERLAGEEERLRADPRYVSEHHRHHSYLARGRYAEQLERWLAQFPREQLLVLRSEDLFADPVEAYARVLAFVGLPPLHLPSYPARNRRPYGGMAKATRERLAEQFREPNRRLERLLERELGWQ